MSSIFYNCYSLISLPDISKWDTNNVTDMTYMFKECSSLTKIPDISEWNKKNLLGVEELNNLFKIFII